MKQTITKVTVSALLALVCLALFASSAQAVQIRAETGAALPTSIIVNENLTVLITDDAGTLIDGVAENARVRYILPADGGTPIPVDVGSDGKTVNPYKPPMTGVLNITVSYGTTLMASQTVNVISTPPIAIRAEDGGDLPTSILVGETFTVLITEDGSPVGAGTNVVFTLPYGTGSPTLDTTDADGKAQYLPLITGTLGIRVLDGTVTVAEATVEVITAAAVDTEPPVAVAEPSHQTVNVSETAYFDGSGSSDNVGIVSYEWDFGDGTDPATGETTSHTYPMVGLYTVTLTVCDAAGNKDTDVADVTVNAPEVSETLSNDTNFTLEFDNANVTGNFSVGVSGDVTVQAVGNVTAYVPNATTVGLGAGYELISGAIVNVSEDIHNALEEGNGTVTIKLCVSDSVLNAMVLTRSNVQIYVYDDEDAGKWVGLTTTRVTGTDCHTADISGYLSGVTVGIGSKSAPPSSRGGGGGGAGTYPPGWGGTLTATSGVTPGAIPGATPGVTPPGEAVTKPTKPAVTEETPSVAEEEAPTKKKPGIPGFTSVFAIAGLLAVAYVLMRRRE